MDPLHTDMLRGITAIGRELGLTRASAQHRILAGQIPVFRMGNTVCARRSTLRTWIAEQEAMPPAPARPA